MPREPPIVLPISLPLLGHANPWALLGILFPGARYALATGDKAAILAYLCAGRRRGRTA